jgi:phosphohistidine phosphatase
MLLLLIRHADAGSADHDRWPDDTLRPLTDRGRKRHRRVGKRLKRHGFTPTLLLASPWLRAWQTAHITMEATGSPAAVACPALAAAPDLRAIGSAIGRPAPDTVVGLVGHEPWLGQLASLLLTGKEGTLALDFPKSGVLGIEATGLSAGAGMLVFMWRPRAS